MGKASRDKGTRFEREIVRLLNGRRIDAKRILEFQYHQANGIDVETDRAYFQCKNMAKVPNIPKVFLEFKKSDKMQVVVFRVTNKGTYACVRLEDFLFLIEDGKLEDV